MRAALGASRARIARSILIESALVASAAAAAGLLLANRALDALVAFIPAELPRMEAIGIDWRVATFTCTASLVASVVFGACAAWPATRSVLSAELRQGAGGCRRGRRPWTGLLAVQSAVSLVLLVGAGLLTATFISLARTKAGFDVRRRTPSLRRASSRWRSSPAGSPPARQSDWMVATLNSR